MRNVVRMRLKQYSLITCLLTFLTSCGSGSSNSSDPELANPSENTSALTILMIGNSHTAVNNVPAILSTILDQSPEATSNHTRRALKSLFLYQHIEDETTLATFNERHWDFVVLQAQRYSQSQVIQYPTDAAESFINMTRNQNGQAILFPEWARFGVNETNYIHNLHQSIAQISPACVAPIGKAWEMSLALDPEIQLHANDGNHANFSGGYLTALVLYETITGNPADLLGYIELEPEIPSNVQAYLQTIATQAISENPPCQP